ncbi:transaldolase family protein [Prosthecomicrobium pneumaticum]|uniref:Transaldolase n=1 Tax=Prosthecomicrobium pneumaticum TaxID=81895 RepID=A0A7W9L2C1_9HYPH|nr:transaldolase family protein [Prosthecomicrobium pneumaticum]MBB5753366.1 transaldolase [Prosthecomicrobium pneumaticum]
MGGTGLRLFLDTAEEAAWRAWLPSGLFHGVTTNPTLLAAARKPCSVGEIELLASAAFGLGAQELQAQSWGRTAKALYTNGRALAAIDDRVVVKVPITREGAEAAARLIAEGVGVTMTAVYAAHQGLSAAALGARYVAPYLGRMNDAGRDGFAEIVAMAELMRAAGGATRILVASLRAADDLVRLARAGVDTFTFGPKVAEALFADPLTAAAAEAFEKAAEGG